MKNFYDMDINTLIQTRDNVKKQYHQMLEKNQTMDDTFENRVAFQNQLEKQYAITLKMIQEYKNDCFVLSRKKINLSDSSELLSLEVEKSNKALSLLDKEWQELDHQTLEYKDKIKTITQDINQQNKNNISIRSKLETLQKEQNEISDDIAKRLSSISAEKDDIETQLNNLNMQFMKYLEEREDVSKTNTELSDIVQNLSNQKETALSTVTHLKTIKEHLTKRDTLNESHQTFEKNHAQQKKQWESLKQTHATSKQTIDNLDTYNNTKSQSIEKLKQDVKGFDQVMQEMESSMTTCENELNTYQQTVEQIKVIQNEIIDLNEKLLAIEDHYTLFNELIEV